MSSEASRGGRPLASLSLDLDNMWSYLKTRGEDAWRERPTYLPRFVPLVLEALDAADLKITFFVVGADAEDPRNHAPLAALAAAGHEIANHSYEHEVWLHTFTAEELHAELQRAEDAIEQATGRRTTGFRGPGFSWSPTLLQVLQERGYQYDASTLPTFIGPVARWYYCRTAEFAADEKDKREALFGAFSDGFRPNKPYRWSLPGERSLLEIPVTTMPVFRVPFHMSYLQYLARVSERLMLLYLETSLRLCRLTRTAPSFLLHPLDLITGEDAPELAFFPGMDLPAARKREIFARVLAMLSRSFDVVPMGEHARSELVRPDLRTRPAFTG